MATNGLIEMNSIYQLVLLYQYEHHLTPGKGVKPLLRAA
jgi:hypothetical protein